MDTVRGIACLMVLFAHLGAIPPFDRIPAIVGPAGVGIFFALSGFLITRGLLHEPRGPNSFYNRRSARILPPYLLTVGALALFWPGKELWWAATYAFNCLYVTQGGEYFHVDAAAGAPISPIAHTWSLCVEEHFYWLWPCLVWMLPRRWLRTVPVAVILATPLFAWGVAEFFAARDFREAQIVGLIQRITPSQSAGLAFGCLAALFERRLRRPAVLPAIAVGLLVAAVAIRWASGRGLLGSQGGLFVGPLWLHTACAAAFGAGLASTWLGRLTPLRHVGTVSYGLYLYHLPVYAAFGLAESGRSAAWWQGAAALAVTALLAVASYRWIEAPIMRWARRNDARLAIPVAGRRVSVGLLVTVLLVVLFAWQIGSWLIAHPAIPTDLRRVTLPAVGTAVQGFRWMGIDHHIDNRGYRRTTPFPAKVAGVPRVVVVGDSFTWGQGVDFESTYPVVAEALLKRGGVDVEVLNCGKAGMQAEDAVAVIKGEILPLRPDVIIYAATTFDFLPAGEQTGMHALDEWSMPENRDRFARSVARMRAACEARGVDFRVIVLTQQPDDPLVTETVRLMERLAAEAGAEAIGVESYLRLNSARRFPVSAWEPHPNVECHRIYADLLVAELRRILFADHR